MKFLSIRILSPIFLCLLLLLPLTPFDHHYEHSNFWPNHLDEFSYLDQVSLGRENLSNTSFYIEHEQILSDSAILKQNVSSFIDVLVGKIFYKVHPYLIGFILDLLCIFISFYLLVGICDFFSLNRTISSLCALLALSCPQLISLDSSGIFPAQIGGVLLNAPISAHMSTSAVRGVYTQIGFVVFLATVYLALSDLMNKRVTYRLLLAAAASGLSVHIYFFAWLSGIFILNVFILTLCVLAIFRRSEIKVFLKAAIAFGFISLLFSLPGLYLIKYLGASLITVCAPEIAKYWYFSPEWVLTLMIAGGVSYFLTRRLPQAENFYLGCFVCSLIFAPLVLMNIQPISSCILSPFRVSFFLIPTYSALVLVLFYKYFATYSRKLAFVGLCVLCGIALQNLAVRNYGRLFSTARIDSKTLELMSFLKNKNLLQKTYAMWPSSEALAERLPTKFEIRVLPSILRSAYGIHLLSQSWIYPGELSIAEIAEREMYSTWLFRGKLDLFIPCEFFRHALPYPGDILELTWMAHLIVRQQLCAYINRNPPELCSLIDRYQVDYLVMDLPEKVPFSLRSFLIKEWSSQDGKIILYKIDKALMKQNECE